MHFLGIDTRLLGFEASSFAIIPTKVSATDFPVRAVLNLVFFLLSDSPASEFSVPAFQETLFHLRLNKKGYMKMEDTECSETSAQKIQTAGNHSKERTLQSK